MKKTIILLLAALTCIACGKQEEEKNNSGKNMTTLTFNQAQADCMSAIACLEAAGDQERLTVAINDGLDSGLTVSQIKEALSQLYAYTGFPRSLNALGTLQAVIKDREANGKETTEGAEPTPLDKNYNALSQGTAVQTQLTGKPFDYTFAPATDYYLKAHLFGDIFARDNLTFADRELITVSALCGLEGVEPQLKAHVNGAHNMGLTDAQLMAIPLAIKNKVGRTEALRASKAICEFLGIEDELGLKAMNAIDLKSVWPKGNPNTAYEKYFIGRSYLADINGINNVTFEPGCRNNWHIHHGAVQVLICVYGRGWYQEWGKKAVQLLPGKVIAVPEGVKHWHGAAKGSWLQHLTYHKDAKPDASNEWLEPVSGEIYDALP